MPSTQRAKIKGAAQTYTSHVERERWWVERDDFETALGALSSGRRLTSLASSPMILPLGDMGGMRSRWSAHGAFKRLRAGECNCVMAGLVPAIHDFASLQQRRLDACDKLGHEEAGPEPVI